MATLSNVESSIFELPSYYDPPFLENRIQHKLTPRYSLESRWELGDTGSSRMTSQSMSASRSRSQSSEEPRMRRPQDTCWLSAPTIWRTWMIACTSGWLCADC